MKDESLQKVTMNLYAGDYDRVKALFPDVGAGPIIRRLIRQYLERIESLSEPPKLTETIDI